VKNYAIQHYQTAGKYAGKWLCLAGVGRANRGTWDIMLSRSVAYRIAADMRRQGAIVRVTHNGQSGRAHIGGLLILTAFCAVWFLMGGMTS